MTHSMPDGRETPALDESEEVASGPVEAGRAIAVVRKAERYDVDNAARLIRDTAAEVDLGFTELATMIVAGEAVRIAEAEHADV